MKKKLALLLAFSLVLSLVPAGTLLADDNDEDYENGYYENYENAENEENDADNDEAGGLNDEDINENDNDADVSDGQEDVNNDGNNNAGNDTDGTDGIDGTDDIDNATESADPTTTDPATQIPIEPIIHDPIIQDPPVVYYPIVPIITTLRFVIGETSFTRNGDIRTLDAAPYIDANAARTMVPLAAIAEGLGATVGWNAETRYVNIIRGNVNITLNVDTELPDGMGMPAIVEDRTFVPLAYVAEMLGADTDWDEDARAVYIVE